MGKRVLSFWLALVIVLFVGAGTSYAHDRWTFPYRGIRHLHRRFGTIDYHAVFVDLTNPRIHIVTTNESILPRDERGRYRFITTRTFARRVRAAVAINANYFEIQYRKATTCGLTVSHGHIWNSSYNDSRLNCHHSLAIGAHHRTDFLELPDLPITNLPSWVEHVVSGSPRLLRDGEIEDYQRPRHALNANPRTAIGVSRDGRTLILMVVNGREGRLLGMPCRHMAFHMRLLGAWNAINLDGGGSSTLYIRAEGGIVSRTGETIEREVGNQLGIVIRDPDPIDWDVLELDTVVIGPKSAAVLVANGLHSLPDRVLDFCNGGIVVFREMAKRHKSFFHSGDEMILARSPLGLFGVFGFLGTLLVVLYRKKQRV